MTNNIKALDVNGVKIELDTNTALIQCVGTSVIGTVTVTDGRDNTQYQVPAGKKATVIYLTELDFRSPGDRLIYADNLNGTTNAVTLIENLLQSQNIIFISAEIPAGKYLNITDAAANPYNFYILEESAT